MSVSIQRYAERCNRSNIEYAEVDDFQEECNLGNTN